MMTSDGSCDAEIKSRLSKANQAFTMLKSVWKAGKLSWKMTKTKVKKLDVFQRKCLRRIVGVCWQNTISNEDLYDITATRPITEEIKRTRWNWIGHGLSLYIARVALHWDSHRLHSCEAEGQEGCENH